MAIYGYLLILLFAVLTRVESIFVKNYAKKYGDGGMLINAVIAFFACSFFVITDTGGFNFPSEMLPLGAINALLYASGFYFMFASMKIGPYGLTQLITGFSLLFSVTYGIFFLGEPTTPLTYIGISLILTATVLINCNGKKNDECEQNKISLRWAIYLFINVCANGFIIILTKMQQIQFNNECSNEFQIISTGGAFLILAIIGIIADRKKIKSIMKIGILYGVGAGLCNGAKNFVQIAALLFLPVSVISPTNSGLGLLTAFLVSIFLYKEKYSILQKIGVACSVGAVVLLAI